MQTRSGVKTNKNSGFGSRKNERSYLNGRANGETNNDDETLTFSRTRRQTLNTLASTNGAMESSESDTLKSFSRMDPNSQLYKYLHQSVSQTMDSVHKNDDDTDINKNNNHYPFEQGKVSNFKETSGLASNINASTTSVKSDLSHLNAKTLLMKNFEDIEEDDEESDENEVSNLQKNQHNNFSNSHFKDQRYKKTRETTPMKDYRVEVGNKEFQKRNVSTMDIDEHTDVLESSFSKNIAARINQHLEEHQLELQNDTRSTGSDEDDADDEFSVRAIVDVIQNDITSYNSSDNKGDDMKDSQNNLKNNMHKHKTISIKKSTQENGQFVNSVPPESHKTITQTQNLPTQYHVNIEKSNFVTPSEQQSISSFFALKSKPQNNNNDQQKKKQQQQQHQQQKSQKIGNDMEEFFTTPMQQYDIGLNGAIRFADDVQNLGTRPSVEGKIDPSTNRLVTVDDEVERIPYGKLWILDRVHRYMELLANPIFQFVRDTAAKTNSNTDVFLKVPDSTLSGSFNRNFNAQTFFRRNDLSAASRERQANEKRIIDENEKKLADILRNDFDLKTLEQTIEDLENIIIEDSKVLQSLEENEQEKELETTNRITRNKNLLRQRINERENRKKILREQFQRQNITTLISRLKNPEKTNSIILDFLDKLEKVQDPAIRAFSSVLERQAIQQFSEEDSSQRLVEVSDARANAQRLWLLAPENLGMFFWDNRFNSAVNQANTFLTLATKRQFNTFNLMTDPLVRDLYSMLVSDILKKYRFTDGSRNLTQKRIKDNDDEIKALVRQFTLVSSGIDGHLHYGTIKIATPNRGKKRGPIEFEEQQYEQDFCAHANKRFIAHNMIPIKY